jgi:hypothetical protein
MEERDNIVKFLTDFCHQSPIMHLLFLNTFVIFFYPSTSVNFSFETIMFLQTMTIRFKVETFIKNLVESNKLRHLYTCIYHNKWHIYSLVRLKNCNKWLLLDKLMFTLNVMYMYISLHCGGSRMYLLYLKLWFRVMVLNATFYLISAISCFIGGGSRSTSCT